MDEYVITTRNSRGSLEERVYHAESRADLFNQLSKDGVSAVRIDKRDRNFKSRTSKSSNGASAVKFSYIAASLGALVIIGAIVFFALSKEMPVETATEIQKKTVKVTEVKPVKVTPKNIEQPKVVDKAPDPKIKPAPWRNKNLTEEQREEAYVKTLSEKEIPKASTNRLFRTGLEQVMSWVFTTEVGDMPPPLPNISDFDIVHLQEILEIKNNVSDNDTDKQAEAKETVDFAKKELKKYLEKGGDPQEFLAYYHDQLKSAYQERKLAQEEVIKVLRTEPDLADDYLKKVNDQLSQRGIKGVVIPERLRLRIQHELSTQQ